MVNPKIILVTGASRGIGKAIVQSLASNPEPLIIIAGSRQGVDLAISPSQPSSQVVYRKLDITRQESIDSLEREISKDYGGGLHALINNAGMGMDKNDSMDVMNTNYLGTKNMCEAFLPLVKKAGGRIVNVSSVGSTSKAFDATMSHRLRNTKDRTEIDAIASEYEQAVKNDEEKKRGFGGPRTAYSLSKALINAYTEVTARENPECLINCCCPGWVDTDMGGQVGKPQKTVEQGAIIPIRLAIEDIKGITGKYWANDSIHGTGNGEARSW